MRSPLARSTAAWVPAIWACAARMSGRLASAVSTIACSSTGGMYAGRVNSPSGSAAPADSGMPIWLRRSARAVR